MLIDRKRIMIVGSGGAGKSTLARELSEVTGLPVVHLDRYFWRPGWVATPSEERRGRVELLAAADAWIIDGNYGGTPSIRVERCDAILFFDFNRITCLLRAVKRSLLHRSRSRPDLAEGCRERLDWAFLRWIWAYPKSSRARVIEAIEAAGDDVEVLIFKSRRRVRSEMEGLRAVGHNPRLQRTGRALRWPTGR